MLYAIKVMDSDGSGYVSDVIQGCQWAIEHKIPIVNMSLGSDYHSIAIRETMSIAASHGMSIIAAAGNDGERGVLSPAFDDVAVCVGASGTDDKRMPWSNYGSAMKSNGVLAPGSWIMAATKEGQWRRVSGTSIATPHVTGIFALLLQVEHTERESLRRLLLQNASRSNSPDEFIGHGVADAQEALDAMLQGH
jgi:subtilisin